MFKSAIISATLFALLPLLAVQAQETNSFCKNAAQTVGTEAFSAYYKSAGMWAAPTQGEITIKEIKDIPELVKCVDECRNYKAGNDQKGCTGVQYFEESKECHIQGGDLTTIEPISSEASQIVDTAFKGSCAEREKIGPFFKVEQGTVCCDIWY